MISSQGSTSKPGRLEVGVWEAVEASAFALETEFIALVMIEKAVDAADVADAVDVVAVAETLPVSVEVEVEALAMWCMRRGLEGAIESM